MLGTHKGAPALRRRGGRPFALGWSQEKAAAKDTADLAACAVSSSYRRRFCDRCSTNASMLGLCIPGNRTHAIRREASEAPQDIARGRSWSQANEEPRAW